jgi:hypothetical protein
VWSAESGSVGCLVWGTHVRVQGLWLVFVCHVARGDVAFCMVMFGAGFEDLGLDLFHWVWYIGWVLW